MKGVKKIMIDMIPVILGILIALFINDWKQNIENERFLNKVLGSIEKEMKHNIEEFNSILPKQYAMIDTIEFYIDNDEISLTEIFAKTKGLQVPTVRNTSWKSFLNSKMELVDFDVISKLTDIEESKVVMGKKLDLMMGSLFNDFESTESKVKRRIIMHLLNVLDSEEELLKSYKEYLEIENKASR